MSQRPSSRRPTTMDLHTTAAERDPWEGLPQVRDVGELAAVGEPTAAVRAKALTTLDPVHVEWIRASPLVFVSTASASGQCDVSPKGDPPGAVLVLDERTLVVPERAGNLRMDGFRNILENPHAGLLFVVPGRPETLRVNGSARLVTDGPFFDDLVVKRHRPRLAVLVRVEEVFFHCPKAFVRSGAWRPARWRPESVRPYAEIAHALWRSDQPLDAVRSHYESGLPDAELYPSTEAAT